MSAVSSARISGCKVGGGWHFRSFVSAPSVSKRRPTGPRRLRMSRPQRLQSARSWLPTYKGKNVVRGYRRCFGVDLLCAVKELRMLGVSISAEREAQYVRTTVEIVRQRAERKALQASGNTREPEIWNFYDSGLNAAADPSRPAPGPSRPWSGSDFEDFTDLSRCWTEDGGQDPRIRLPVCLLRFFTELGDLYAVFIFSSSCP